MLDIDHHLGNSLFGKLNFVLESECSTGSVVMRILRELGVKIDGDDRDVHPGRHHDRHRRLHAFEYDAGGARQRRRA